MAKFKVGDRVKIIKNINGGTKDNKYIGKVGIIVKKARHDVQPYDIRLQNGDLLEAWAEDEFKLMTKGRPFKLKPVKYIAFYDEEDKDPTKKFTSKKELNEWLKEAQKDEDIVFSSIKVYEIKKEYEVLTSFSLKGI